MLVQPFTLSVWQVPNLKSFLGADELCTMKCHRMRSACMQSQVQKKQMVNTGSYFNFLSFNFLHCIQLFDCSKCNKYARKIMYFTLMYVVLKLPNLIMSQMSMCKVCKKNPTTTTTQNFTYCTWIFPTLLNIVVIPCLGFIRLNFWPNLTHWVVCYVDPSEKLSLVTEKGQHFKKV